MTVSPETKALYAKASKARAIVQAKDKVVIAAVVWRMNGSSNEDHIRKLYDAIDRLVLLTR